MKKKELKLLELKKTAISNLTVIKGGNVIIETGPPPPPPPTREPTCKAPERHGVC